MTIDKVRLSIILATTGRPSLNRMLRSITAQHMDREDEIILVGNIGDADVTDPHIRWISMPPGNNWGHAERNCGMRFARGTHLMFVDDDDTLTVGALDVVRKAIYRSPDKPIMFRMIDPNGAVLWRERKVLMGNHGTPQFVVPNQPDLLGEWGDRYEGDFDFVTSTLAKFGGEESLVWNHSIIYACRNQG